MASRWSYSVVKGTEDCGFTEGPHWDETKNELVFVDAFVGNVHRMKEGCPKETVSFGKLVSAIIPYKSKNDNYVVMCRENILKLNWGTQEFELLHEVDKECPHTALNDSKCDENGRLWTGTAGQVDLDTLILPGRHLGSLYSVDPELNYELKRHVGGISISNGMAWSLDNRTFFYCDSMEHLIYAFDFDISTGTLSNQRVLINFKENPLCPSNGLPDGMTTDTEGKIWVVAYNSGKILRIDPETSTVIETLEFPISKVTSCCFGGPHFSQLYVTSGSVEAEKDTEHKDSGSILRVDGLSAKGFPAFRFSS